MIYEKDLTDKIIGCAIDVHKFLGAGFLEKVYENALCIELTNNNIAYTSQKGVKVYYHNHVVGDYIIDILVEEKIILELKACWSILPVHEAQLHNYLVATKNKVGYILNFGNQYKLEFKRIIV